MSDPEEVPVIGFAEAFLPAHDFSFLPEKELSSSGDISSEMVLKRLSVASTHNNSPLTQVSIQIHASWYDVPLDRHNSGESEWIDLPIGVDWCLMKYMSFAVKLRYGDSTHFTYDRKSSQRAEALVRYVVGTKPKWLKTQNLELDTNSCQFFPQLSCTLGCDPDTMIVEHNYVFTKAKLREQGLLRV